MVQKSHIMVMRYVSYRYLAGWSHEPRRFAFWGQAPDGLEVCEAHRDNAVDVLVALDLKG